MSNKNAGTPRTMGRDSLFLFVILAGEDGTPLGKGVVRNLSATGMLIEGDVTLTLHQVTVFTLGAAGEVRGEVVRADHGRFGIRFDREINPQLARRKRIHTKGASGASQIFKKPT